MNERILMSHEQEYKNMQAVASILEATSANNFDYEVKDVYLDYSQDWMWTTIVCYDWHTHKRALTWQILSPALWADVVTADGEVELMNVVHEIKYDLGFLDN